MIKDYKLTYLKLILSINILIKYSLWTMFFVLQGNAINMAIHQNNLYKQLIYTLIAFILVKMLVMLCDVLQKYITEHFKNDHLKQQWSENFPTFIYHDNIENKNDINLLFFDILPKLFDLNAVISTNTTTIAFIFTLTIAVFLYSGFYLSLSALFLVFGLNYLSQNVFTQQINDYQSKTLSSHADILNWVDQYFSSFKEISKNWQGIENSSWKNNIYKKYFHAKKNQILFYLYRDLLSQLLVELPFLISTSFVILGVYYNYLSISQLFIWTGFSQFMISASNAYLDNKVKVKQRLTLDAKSHDILSLFKKTNLEYKENIATEAPLSSEVILRDGTKNILSLISGIYHIKGKNGSGKSTLMNMILGFDRKSEAFENTNFAYLVGAIQQDNARVIERDAVVFSCLDSFNCQVLGPGGDLLWKNKINQSLEYLLPENIATEWGEIFIALEAEYDSREKKILSSGERIILSLMRFFASWDQKVRVLVVDECDSFLDSYKKRLFMRTVEELGLRVAVYFSTHDAYGVCAPPTPFGLRRDKSCGI